MLTFIKNRLEQKIVLSMVTIIAVVVGVYTYFDIQAMREDAVRTSERTLGAFATAIKGSIVAAMRKERHEDVKTLLKELNAPDFIDRVMIYNENGRPILGMETLHSVRKLDIELPLDVLGPIMHGNLSRTYDEDGNHYISYYAPMANLPECHRCHGSDARLNGILRIDFSLRDLDDLIAVRSRRGIQWGIGLFVLLTAVLSALVRFLVSRPVMELRNAMGGVTEGSGALNLSTEGSDELADLKRSFVSMLERISSLHQVNLEKEKELARHQEEMRFRSELQSMFDAMQEGILLVDPALNIIQRNPRILVLLPALGASGGRISEDQIRDPRGPYFGIRIAFRQNLIHEHQCSIALPDGQERHLHVLCAPIVERDRVRFVVMVVRDITERIRTERELEDKTSQLIAVNKKLSLMATTDSLTQVCNRHRFDEILLQEIKRCARRQYDSLSLMMIDIDHFKRLNDLHGHLAGDAVLREIAALFKGSVRETDTVARYGGEEFVIIMPGTSLESAALKAEVLRLRVLETRFLGSLPLSVSIGVTEYAGGTPEDLVQTADQALYQAKNNGRNRVIVQRRDEVRA